MEKYDTLKYYNENAHTYSEQTKYGDMTLAYKKFLTYLPKGSFILDFGCGSGRDSKFFIDNGYKVCAVDGSEEMCKEAEEYINQEVKCMRFDELSDENKYDGIWACSSILHVEREELPDILRKMIIALKDNGVIYTCFKIGDKYEIFDGKYYNYINKEIFEKMLNEINPNYQIVDYYESITSNNINRPTANWGNYLIKKIK